MVGEETNPHFRRNRTDIRLIASHANRYNYPEVKIIGI
jgi:hypothetical protein